MSFLQKLLMLLWQVLHASLVKKNCKKNDSCQLLTEHYQTLKPMIKIQTLEQIQYSYAMENHGEQCSSIPCTCRHISISCTFRQHKHVYGFPFLHNYAIVYMDDQCQNTLKNTHYIMSIQLVHSCFVYRAVWLYSQTSHSAPNNLSNYLLRS